MDDKLITDHDIINAMYRYGGSFIRALAITLEHADPTNFAKLKAAFPDEWVNYADLAQLIRDRAAKS